MIMSAASILDGLDNYLLDFHRGMAGYLQNKTYRNKDEIAGKLHLVSSAAYFTSAVSGNITSAPFALVEGARYVFGAKLRLSADEERIMRQDGTWPKFWDLFIYGSGACITAGSLGALIYGLFSGDADRVSYGNNGLNLGLGLGSLLWKTGDYLERVDVGNPPKKPKKRTFRQLASDTLLPKPKLEPVPERIWR